MIITQVDKVFARFGQPDQEALDVLTAERAAAMLAAGEFPAGSMGPKIESALAFLDGGGREVIITDPGASWTPSTAGRARASCRLIPVVRRSAGAPCFSFPLIRRLGLNSVPKGASSF